MNSRVIFQISVVFFGVITIIGAQPGIERKTVVVGDEFTSVSIGFLHNRTEYEVQLNTTGHRCSNAYVCEVFMTLTEMFCKNISTAGSNPNEQPYLEINGVIGGDHPINLKWCRHYGISGDFAQDEFSKFQRVIITPRGDWSKTNATVLLMSSFYEQIPMQIETRAVGDSPLELVIDSDGKQYEFHLNTSSKTCSDNGGDCSVGAHIDLACPETGDGGSTELELDAISINNERVSKILLPLCNDANGVVKNISTYLVNVRTLILTPSGNWKSPGTAFAHISLATVTGEKSVVCPDGYFDCQDCTSGVHLRFPPAPPVMKDDQSKNIFQMNQDTALRCFPRTWVCPQGQFCENQCTAAEKFCRRSGGDQSPPQLDAGNGKNEYNATLKFCMMYHFLLLVTLVLIIVVLVGMLCLLRRRSAGIIQEPIMSEEHSCPRQGFLLGKCQKGNKIPYHHLMENVA